jgi:hypothetical protein
MKTIHLAAALLFAASAPAIAQDAATAAAAADAPRAGSTVATADGWRLGKVAYLDRSKDGSVASIAVIYEGRMIHVPASTLTVKDKDHVVTSLNHKQASAL